MPEFQGGQFLQRFSEKERIERGQKAPFGTGVVQGGAAALQDKFTQGAQRRASNYDMALNIIKDRLKTSQPYHEKTNKALGLEEEIQLANKIASGNFNPSGSGIAWRPREVTKTKFRTTRITPTAENIADLKKHLPGYNFAIDQPIELPVSSYDRFMTRMGKKPSYELQKKKLEFQKSKYKAGFGDNQIINYWKYLNKQYADPFTDDVTKEDVFDEMEEIKSLYEDVISKAKAFRGLKDGEKDYKHTATNPKTGQKIYSNDGTNWVDDKGKAVK